MYCMNSLCTPARHWWQIDGNNLYVKEVIAVGGFGAVYRGTYGGRDVAVKFVDANPEGRSMFQREVSFWSSLNHPNIAKFIGATHDTTRVKFRGTRLVNVYCMVSQYYPRGSLSAYLSRHPILSEDVIRRMALDAARGLSYLHDKGIVHGDVKPCNFLVDLDGTVKVTDFGLSHLAAYYTSSEVGGTINYMAPEVIKDGKSSLKADVYSFGITLWEICHRKTPHSNMITELIDQGVVHHVISHTEGEAEYIGKMSEAIRELDADVLGRRPAKETEHERRRVQVNPLKMLPTFSPRGTETWSLTGFSCMVIEGTSLPPCISEVIFY